jgi:uncharacterized membrane protein HdeD (DUF308 family)
MTDTTESDRGLTGLELAREWPAAFLIGLITLGLGVVVISWPQETLTVISVLIGLQILIYGIYRLITAFAHDTASPGFTGFIGIVGIIAGIVVLRHPFQTVAVLAVVLGVVWIIGGSIEVLAAIADSTLDHRGLLAFGGLLSIAAGVVVVVWPAPTVTVVAWIAGLYLIIFGLFICFQAFQLRRLTK